MFLPKLRFTKQPRCLLREKQGYPLAHRTEVKEINWTPLDFRRRKIAPSAGDICDWSQGQRRGKARRPLCCRSPCSIQAAGLSHRGGGWSQHPQLENRNGILGPVIPTVTRILQRWGKPQLKKMGEKDEIFQNVKFPLTFFNHLHNFCQVQM